MQKFFNDLKREIAEDNVTNNSAALAYYFFLAIFPGMLVMLAILPYLPIANLDKAIMDLLHQALPDQAAKMFTSTVQEITTQKKGGLLSVGLLLTLWSASNGMYAIMQALNVTYDVKEGRPFWKVRLTALGLTLLFGALLVGALSLVIFGGKAQDWMQNSLHLGNFVVTLFAVLRWVIITGAMMLAYALAYYLAPDVEQKFKFVSPGSVLGVVMLMIVSLVFKLYVSSFGKFDATYGSIGAVIAMMLWLNLMGLSLLLGSEVNALIEHYSPEGKSKGEKVEHGHKRAA